MQTDYGRCARKQAAIPSPLRQARELSAARICYDHLAGRLSVDLTDSLVTHAYIVVGDEAAEITRAGIRFLTAFGIDLSALSSKRRPFCRLCIDWTERRPHIAGAVGPRLRNGASISAGRRG